MIEMASKTIMIQEDTYNKLVKLKQNNESFNDLINRLIPDEQNLDPYFGILTSEEGNQLENAIDMNYQIMKKNDQKRQVEF